MVRLKELQINDKFKMGGDGQVYTVLGFSANDSTAFIIPLHGYAVTTYSGRLVEKLPLENPIHH